MLTGTSRQRLALRAPPLLHQLPGHYERSTSRGLQAPEQAPLGSWGRPPWASFCVTPIWPASLVHMSSLTSVVL